MKKYFAILTLILLAGGFTTLYAQNISSDTIATGELTFNETLHDFGQISQNANGTCEFNFTNTGDVVVTLSNVRSSCGCTIPTWPHEPIMPGENSKIIVKYDTKRIGAFSKTITVYANVEGAPLKLNIKGVVNSLAEKE